MRVGQLAHNRQTKSKASVGSPFRALCLSKAIEDMGNQIWGNTLTVVNNLDQRL
jgi:hypothetical protein